MTEEYGKTGGGEAYVPHDGEPFMNPRQLAWFKTRLLELREDILRTSGRTLNELGQSTLREPDVADRAASEADWTTELRTRDRQRKLLVKIAHALSRMRDGEYGYCEVTGEEIAIARLLARPTASMTLDAQETHERRERESRAA